MTSIVLVLILVSAVPLARRAHLRAAAAAQADLQTIFDAAPIGNLVLDGDERVVNVNAAFARLVGRPARELPGQALAQLVHAEDLKLLRIGFAQLRHDVSAELATEVRLLHAVTGAPIAASIHATRLTRRGAGAPRMLVQVLDVTERKRVEAQLKHLADHDSLTSLLNRRRFEQELARHAAQVRRYGAEGAVMVLDVDHFKLVNDTCGHGAGDRLIVGVAAALQRRLRETDVIARLGGDEFAILLPKADRDGAEAVARSLVETIREHAAEPRDGELRPPQRVTISVGVAMMDACGELTADEIVAAADVAMYAAKKAGRDGYAFAGAPTARRIAA
jgi:diguanylate cyclase (GGDEF)-like protein/PAS domain S-box-containing protein